MRLIRRREEKKGTRRQLFWHERVTLWLIKRRRQSANNNTIPRYKAIKRNVQAIKIVLNQTTLTKTKTRPNMRATLASLARDASRASHRVPATHARRGRW